MFLCFWFIFFRGSCANGSIPFGPAVLTVDNQHGGYIQFAELLKEVYGFVPFCGFPLEERAMSSRRGKRLDLSSCSRCPPFGVASLGRDARAMATPLSHNQPRFG